MTISLYDYLWFKQTLKQDEEIDYELRLKRDRNIALKLKDNKPSTSNKQSDSAKFKQILHWKEKFNEASVDNIGAETAENNSLLNKSIKLLNNLQWILIFIGLFCGATIGGSLFYYTGQYPINIINFIWVIVIIQSLFIIIMILSFLPYQWQKFLPGFSLFNKFFSQFNMGKWAMQILNWLVQRRFIKPESIDMQNFDQELLTFSEHEKKLVQWKAAWLSQWFSLCLNIGLLLSVLYLVTFSDLAFGWSSTLDIQPDFLHQLTNLISLPWAVFSENAVPSMDLIEQTRFYRASSALSINMDNEKAMMLGQWWPFVMLSIIFYGIITRITLLIMTNLGFNRELNKSLMQLPSVTLLLQRMNTKLVETKSLNTPETFINDADNSDAILKTIQTQLNDNSLFLHWGDKISQESDYWQLLANKTLTHLFITDIGFESYQQDVEMVAELVKKHKSNNIVLFVKAWEPPMLSLFDWLAILKTNMADLNVSILAYDVRNNPDQEKAKIDIITAKSQELKVWQNQIIRQKQSDVQLIHL